MTNSIVHGNCPICDNQAQLFPKIRDNEHYICPCCGEYKISGTGLEILRKRPLNDHERKKVSQAIKNLLRLGGQLLIPGGFIDDARREC